MPTLNAAETKLLIKRLDDAIEMENKTLKLLSDAKRSAELSRGLLRATRAALSEKTTEKAELVCQCAYCDKSIEASDEKSRLVCGTCITNWENE